jgi:hypothetical protein
MSVSRKEIKLTTIQMIGDLERCPLCGKILYRKKGAGMRCLDGCQQIVQRIASNTFNAPGKLRRKNEKFTPLMQKPLWLRSSYAGKGESSPLRCKPLPAMEP